jgi:hypothetical protein
MKKLLYLFLVLGLFACSSDSADDDENNNNSCDAIEAQTNLINPPSWILGTWINENAEAEDANGNLYSYRDGFTFCSNNFGNVTEGCTNCEDDTPDTFWATQLNLTYSLESVDQNTYYLRYFYTSSQGTGEASYEYDRFELIDENQISLPGFGGPGEVDGFRIYTKE